MILVTPFIQYYTCILKLIISAYFIDKKTTAVAMGKFPIIVCNQYSDSTVTSGYLRQLIM